jgi:hypothetical protein
LPSQFPRSKAAWQPLLHMSGDITSKHCHNANDCSIHMPWSQPQHMPTSLHIHPVASNFNLKAPNLCVTKRLACIKSTKKNLPAQIPLHHLTKRFGSRASQSNLHVSHPYPSTRRNSTCRTPQKTASSFAKHPPESLPPNPKPNKNLHPEPTSTKALHSTSQNLPSLYIMTQLA